MSKTVTNVLFAICAVGVISLCLVGLGYENATGAAVTAIGAGIGGLVMTRMFYRA